MKIRTNNTAFAVSSLIAIVLFLGASPGFCQDFFVATVLAVDLEKMTIEVLPLSTGKPVPTNDENGQSLVVRIAEESNLARDGSTAAFPGCVRVGENIRLWGGKAQNADNTFLATDIRGCRNGGCSDPTGVRSRLLQGRKKKQRLEKHTDPTEGTYGFDGDGHGGGGHSGAGSGGGAGGGGGGGGGGR